MRPKAASKKCIELFSALFLAYVLSWVVCVGAHSVEVANDRLVISNNKYEVAFIGEAPVKDRPWLTSYIFQIVNKETQEISQFVLENAYTPIKETHVKLHLLEDHRLIVQEKWEKRPDASTGIHIVDVKKNELIDEFWCYDPVLSPSKRFWAYKKFFYPHELPAAQTTVVLIYDMKKAPLENRVPVKGYGEFPEFHVGLPIYPEPYVKAKAYVLPKQQIENPFWYIRSSPFLWAEDEFCVVFLCTHKEQTYIVKVDLTSGIEKPKIFESPIKVIDEWIEPRYKKGFDLDVARGNLKLLYTISATEIAWDGPNHIIVKPSEARYYLKEKIRLPVP
ncbi:MAG: hypothetical protein Q7J55_03030 [bacterium]|nr:hypothetical protein [bacterium]